MILGELLGPEASEHFLDVVWHGNGDGGASSVESDGHSEVLIAVGADRNFVIVTFKGRFQVVDIEL
jgi:hypothetical protein